MIRIPMESEAFPSGLAGESGAAGMLRIRRGEQTRWIWPVHLPGWIALGWQVSHRGVAPLEAPAMVMEPAAEPLLAEQPDKPEDPEQPATALEAAPAEPSRPTTVSGESAIRARRGKRRPGTPITPAASAAEPAAADDATAVGIDGLLLDPLL